MYSMSWWIHAWIVLSMAFEEARGRELPLRPANVIFLVDESNSIWEADFKRELRFVQETVRRFEVGENFTRVGLVTYSMYPKVLFGLDVFNDTQSIIRAIDKIKRPEGYQTRLSPALQTSSTMLGANDTKTCKDKRLPQTIGDSSSIDRYRSIDVEEAGIDSPINILILMGDGELNDFKESFEMSRCLNRQKVHLFSVGVGKWQIKRVMDEFAAEPHLYRISIDSFDPPNHPDDAIASSKSAPIWELMLKYKAMTEECIPHKEKIVLNFIFDIISKKSWRYPTFVRIAEDMYFRLRKTLKTRKKDFIRVRFYPKNFAKNNTRYLRNKAFWNRTESERLKEMLDEGRMIRRMKKNSTKVVSVAAAFNRRKEAWEMINALLSKIKHVNKQQIVVYLTDRATGQVKNVEEISRMMRRNLRAGYKLEMFAIAIGSRVDEIKLSSLLRQYHTTPQSRLVVLKTMLKGYEEAVDNFTKLFCPIKTS